MSDASGSAVVRGMEYPAARVSDQVDTYFGTAVADPYRWMEDVDSPEVKAWVDAENRLTQGFLAGIPERGRIHARLMELVNFERFGMPAREGGRYFYARNSGLQNQAVLFWQEGEDGTPVELIDPNLLREDGTVSLEGTSASNDGRLLAYALAEAGSDVKKVRVKVVETGEDLPDEIGWVKFSGISWAHDGSGFYYSSFGVPKDEAERAEALKHAAKFHKVYFHVLGTPQSEDRIVYERPDDGEFLVGADVTEDGRYLILVSSKGDHNTLLVRDLDEPERLVAVAPVADSTTYVLGNVGSRMWLKTNKGTPKSRIVTVELGQPEEAHWTTVVAEREEPLESAVMAGDTLVLTYLQDARSRVEQFRLDGTPMREVALPGLGVAGVGGGRRTDTELFYLFTNYTTPATIYRLELATGTSTVWRQPKLRFNPEEYETEQVFAESKDGTRVPLFVTYRKGMRMDGSAPAILYGYGGFNVSLGPAYSSSRLAWLEMGGVYAEAILRGGGEYGEAWHQAGTKLEKQNVFDDFLACAELLIAKRYTCAAKLATNGGSNGGLLVSATALQRPELFGAVMAQVGVMDMLRFDRFTIGYSWKSDYGSPSENEAEFRALHAYSPLHNVHAGTRYPPMLITTADHDDRVYPAHSFKFAATMQAAAEETPDAAPVLIRVETRAGHGGGMPLSKQMDVTADLYAFLVKELGMQ